MRGTFSGFLTKNISKRLFALRGTRGGVVPSLEPQNKEINTNEVKMNTNEEAEPIVTFSRPPPFLPFIGPLVAISLLETWSSHDTDDDDGSN